MRIVMKKVCILLLTALLPVSSLAAGGSSVKLEHVEINLNDTHALQNGAKIFVNYCLGCHSAEYMRYNRLTKDLGIPEELVLKDMISSDAKIGDPMNAIMPAEKSADWFGVTPPDLSLTGRLHDAKWLYNYFISFYVDPNSVSGWNNTVFENVAMPHVLADMQGRRAAVFKEVDGKKEFDRFEVLTEGAMSDEEFKSQMKDLTAYLVYMGEPAKLKRVKYGIYVMLFLFLLAGLSWMLKKEYWRDIKSSH